MIIADDGSGREISELVNSFRTRLNIRHIRQDDRGFRKCLILNKAVHVSRGEKLFFFDGDVVIHPRYLEVSRSAVKPGRYMVSRSAYLSEYLTGKILRKKIPVEKIFGLPFSILLIYDGLFGKTRFFEYGIFLPHILSRIACRLKRDKHIFGRSWAIHKSDYDKVNGYNNDFVGAYYEDFEITSRLKFAGAKPYLMIDRAVSYHLFHKRIPMEPENLEIHRNTIKSKMHRCMNGLDNTRDSDIMELTMTANIIERVMPYGNNPLVSVILPTYNREYLIVEAIESVLSQSYSNLELIVVDDCSTDSTKKKVTDLKDSRIRYVKLEKNRGPAYGRNVGINLAKGEFVAFQDDDDYWLKDKLEKQVKALSGSPITTGMVYTGIYNVKKDRKKYIPSKKNVVRDGLIFRLLLRGNFVPIHALIRRNCFEKTGLFDEDLPVLEDWDMWIKISMRYKILYIREPLVICHDLPGSINKNWRKIILARKNILRKYYGFLKENYVLLSHHFYRIGKILIEKRRDADGLKHIYKAIGYYPFSYHYWKILLIGFFHSAAKMVGFFKND
ncbi:MAG: glycosyltransferase [bacterium]